MQIKYLKSIVRDAVDVPSVLDKAGVEFVAIDKIDWPDQYPYCPDAKVRIAYNSLSIMLHYKVTEDSVRGLAEDNGKIWTDSCVEFFCQFNEGGIYYNIECNCIGNLLIGAGANRNDRERADADTLGSVQRWASLGRKVFEEKQGPVTWEVALIIPLSAFFKHRIRSLAGVFCKANFYKCGDELQKPHFLSWSPIQLDKPNFHCPEFFDSVDFLPE